MTVDRRWQVWRRAFIAGMVLSVGSLAVALATRSTAGAVIALVMSPVLMVLLLVTLPRRNVVPPHLQGLDHDQRRLVVALANRGARAPDPVLAEAVAAHARRQRTGHILLLLSGAIPVGLRLPELVAGDAGAFDTTVILFWLLLAGFMVRGLVRTTRAIAANR